MPSRVAPALVVFHGTTEWGAVKPASDPMPLEMDMLVREIVPRVRTAAERPLRVYHDWGFYGHASTREAADLRETNRRFYAYLRTKGFEPAGGESQDGVGWASWRDRTDRLFAALFPPVLPRE